MAREDSHKCLQDTILGALDSPQQFQTSNKCHLQAVRLQTLQWAAPDTCLLYAAERLLICGHAPLHDVNQLLLCGRLLLCLLPLPLQLLPEDERELGRHINQLQLFLHASHERKCQLFADAS